MTKPAERIQMVLVETLLLDISNVIFFGGGAL